MKPVLLIVLGILLASSPGIARESGTEVGSSKSSRSKSEAIEKGDKSSAEDARVSSNLDIELMERLVLEETNRAREAHRLPKFGSSSRLASAARRHSTDMAQRNYFSHGTKRFLKDGDLGSRIYSEGYRPRMIAENIAMLPVAYATRVVQERSGMRTSNRSTTEFRHTYREMACSVVQQWMDSPGHRRNILDPALDSLGIGCAVGTKSGTPYVYFTQDFAQQGRSE